MEHLAENTTLVSFEIHPCRYRSGIFKNGIDEVPIKGQNALHWNDVTHLYMGNKFMFWVAMADLNELLK